MSVVEFAGMPKSGKTTTLEIVRHEIRRSQLATTDFHGGGRYAPIDKQNIVELNMFLAAEAVKFLAATPTHEKAADTFHLMDRGVFDRVIFTETLRRRGLLSMDECKKVIDFLLSDFTRSRVEHIFVFVTSPKISLEREYKNKIHKISGRVMNDDMLLELQRSAIDCMEKYGPLMQSIHLINTEEMDNLEIETAMSVVKILGIEEKTKTNEN